MARWLRLLGYDTHYSKDLVDNELILNSETEGRILLTCDLELYRRAVKDGVPSFLLKPDSLVNRLTVLARTYGLEIKIDPANSRCPICNGRIRGAIGADKLEERIPQRILSTNKEFWICTNCSKVYWLGGHWRNITRTIEEAKRLLNQRPSPK